MQIDDVNYRHEAIADFMLTHPEMKKGEIAETLGFTQAWLSAVINSDAFIAYYEQRRLSYNAELHQQTVNKLYELAIASADQLVDIVQAEGTDPRIIIDAKDKALQHLGYGTKNGSQAPGGGNTTNIFVASPEGLKAARERMSQFHSQQSAEVVDGEILSSGEGDGGSDISRDPGVRDEATTPVPSEKKGD